MVLLLLVAITAPRSYAAVNGYTASYVVGQPDFSSTDCASGLTGYCSSWASDTAVDTVHHRLFMGDYSNSRVLVYQLDSSDRFTDSVPHTPTYVLGQPDLVSNFYNNNCSQADTNQATTCEPYGIVYDSKNNRLFVENISRISVFDLSSGISNGMDASYVIGQPDFTTDDYGLTQNRFCSVYGGIALDEQGGFLYVNDPGCYRVLVFNVNPGYISNGMDASNVIGQSTFTSNDLPIGNATSSIDSYYGGIVFDNVQKRLFAVDGNAYDRIMVYDMSHGVTDNMPASYVIGQPDFSAYNSGCSANSFGYLSGIGYDQKNQELFGQDPQCRRVLIFDLSNGITNGMDASMVIGQTDFNSGENLDPSQTRFGGPWDANLAFSNNSNTFYFVDGDLNRTLLFNFVKINQDSLPNFSLNQHYSQNITTSYSQGAVTYSVSSGALPPGLTLDSTTGLISGTPNVAGSYTFSITAKDDNGSIGYYKDTNTYTLSLAINSPNTGFGSKDNNPIILTAIYIISGVYLLSTLVIYMIKKRIFYIG